MLSRLLNGSRAPESANATDSVVVEEGQSPYVALDRTLQRWGDYNGVSVGPSSGRFWTVSQYSPDVDVSPEDEERDPYYTRIAEIDVDDE